MKQIALVTLAVLATWTAVEAKGGKQVFNYPYPYDYSREKKPGYIKDYCEDSVGNHLYCAGDMQAGLKNGAYVSTYQAR